MSVDWSPKPFRRLDVWQSDGRFSGFVRSKWISYEVHGGRMFILKKVENAKSIFKNLE